MIGFVAGGLLGPSVAASAADDAAAYKRAVEQQFEAWLQARWPEAQAEGVSRETFEREVKGLTLDWSLPHLVLPDPAYLGGPRLPQSLKPKAPARQPEFDSPERYFKISNLNALAAQGKTQYHQYKTVLTEVQKRYQVPGSIIVAIWGRETNFGTVRLPNDALQSIATQAFLGRRPEVFTEEFIKALKVLQDGHISRSEMRSSWAGAMGHTQFLPSDFLKYAVDIDQDGKRDIWESVPDALASAGNSLHSQGWIGDQEWGYEIDLPAGFDCTLQGPDKTRSFGDWVDMGITRVKGRPFPKEKLENQGFLVLPAGMEGPAFLVTENFSVLKKYNNSDVYALFVGKVADMIEYGAPAGFVGAWKPVDRFTRDRMLAFQEVLVKRYGYDVGNVDGLVGFKTRQAIGLYEKKAGAPLTCYPSKKIVDAVLGQQ
ncbi:lytic murein transglycosylase [Methyloligella halotolerans]|uniref:lytic murein transglycosylase n=1 Tax=Methyloligella halotolerans TaxID=1177755 RepID=UPI001471E124|nr:lytic murein transglycosylase [Methyloligella halotolerans]